MRQPSITIIGAGFGGIGTAIELKRAGYRDITVLEKADGVGGVWRENNYPNAACDVPVVALLLVLRAQPGLAAPLLPPGRDPRLHRAHRPRAGRARPGPHRRRGHLGGVRRDNGDAGTSDRRRRDDRHRRARHRRGPALPPFDPRSARPRHLHRARPSTPRSGTTRSTCAASGSPCSAPVRARSSSCPASSPRPAQMTVFQRSAPYVAPKPDREYTRDPRPGLPTAGRAPRPSAAADLAGHRAASTRRSSTTPC